MGLAGLYLLRTKTAPPYRIQIKMSGMRYYQRPDGATGGNIGGMAAKQKAPRTGPNRTGREGNAVCPVKYHVPAMGASLPSTASATGALRLQSGEGRWRWVGLAAS